jgi:hypothetical protein
MGEQNSSHKMKLEDTELDMPNLYDMNKSLMESQKPLSKTKIRDAEDELRAWFAVKVKEFAMLFNKENADYTILQLYYDNNDSPTLASEQVIDTLKERGEIISICPEGDAYEIWIKQHETGEYLVYYLFSYDQAVIKCDREWLRQKGWLR